MATRTRRHRRSARRRVRRNPPKMTPAMRRKIGARIRALHRAGKYRRTARRSVVRSTRRARRVASASVVRYSRRRATRRGFLRSSGGGSIGLKSVISKDNLMMAAGALGATFVTNYSAALILPKLGSMANNPFVNAAFKLAVTGVTAKLVSKYSRPAAQGILIGGLLVVANDLIRRYGPGTALASATATSAYLGGRRVAAYLGGPRNPALAPVSPTNATFSRRTGGVYGGGSAFKADAWAR